VKLSRPRGAKVKENDEERWATLVGHRPEKMTTRRAIPGTLAFRGWVDEVVIFSGDESFY
jgi:hypothetical protein